jgi:hypothetical protein
MDLRRIIRLNYQEMYKRRHRATTKTDTGPCAPAYLAAVEMLPLALWNLVTIGDIADFVALLSVQVRLIIDCSSGDSVYSLARLHIAFAWFRHASHLAAIAILYQQ